MTGPCLDKCVRLSQMKSLKFGTLNKIGLLDLETVPREKRLRWYGYVMRRDGALKMTYDLKVTEKRGRGHTKVFWPQLLSGCSSGGLSQSFQRQEDLKRRCEICHACSQPSSYLDERSLAIAALFLYVEKKNWRYVGGRIF